LRNRTGPKIRLIGLGGTVEGNGVLDWLRRGAKYIETRRLFDGPVNEIGVAEEVVGNVENSLASEGEATKVWVGGKGGQLHWGFDGGREQRESILVIGRQPRRWRRR